MKAVRCPVCEGVGVFRGVSDGTQTVVPEYSCHGCKGKGWVEVSEVEGIPIATGFCNYCRYKGKCPGWCVNGVPLDMTVGS